MSDSILDIINFCCIENVFECLSRFNSKERETMVTLRAFGGALSKGIDIARILQKEAGITVHNCSIKSINIKNTNVPFIEIPFSAENSNLDNNDENKSFTIPNRNNFFINYSTYQLLFDYLLKKNKTLKISRTLDQKSSGNIENEKLLKISEENGKRCYEVCHVSKIVKEDERERIKEDEVFNALYRSGELLFEKWQKIGSELAKFDDIIVGLDTNILYNCTISKHLLPYLSLVELNEYIHTPNWILIVIPGPVLFELEEASNIRDKWGNLRYIGRMGYRALQELVELSENIDVPGVSVFVYGETNPMIDIKNTLTAIRKDFRQYITKGSDHFKKSSSSGDMAIRLQFKKFLSQMDFHKGSFFLTSDKSNSALAQAEGLRSLYIPHRVIGSTNYIPSSRQSGISWAAFRDNKNYSTKNFKVESKEILPVQVPECPDNLGNQLTLVSPIANIIYELAVSFGSITISYGDKHITLECDRKGDDLGIWVHKKLKISREHLSSILKDYSGRFNLKKAEIINNKLAGRLENAEWLNNNEVIFGDNY